MSRRLEIGAAIRNALKRVVSVFFNVLQHVSCTSL